MLKTSINNFIVYKSSAGSGKTFTLVKEYLKIALKDKYQLNKSYKSILAITFTNKAASEMKWRIIKALREISSESNDFLSSLISEELYISKEDLSERANIVLSNILHNYSDFSIGTIDSFTHRIIRTFALDLKLPINFQIETDSDLVFKKIISSLINNLGKDVLITDYLVNFSISQVEENKNWDPEKNLIEFIKEINKEGVNDLVSQLNQFNISDFNNIKKQLKNVINNYENYIISQGEKALELIKSHQLDSASFYQTDKGIFNFFIKLADFKEVTTDSLINKFVQATLYEDKWYGGKASTTEKSAIENIKVELTSIVNNVISYLKENEQRYTVFSLISKNIYAMGLVNELSKLTAQYKLDENILFISEFNELISEVVNNEPTPFIFERLGDKYKHFLLDEFQDTSAMQWKNMLPLIDNSLGNGNLNLVVGDGKQSIYRWRNADVDQFVNLPNIKSANKNQLVIEREKSLQRNFEEKFLNVNYRSATIIVQFNNMLFDYLSNHVLHEEYQNIYHHQKQEYKLNDDGFVSIDFPEVTEDDTKENINNSYILNYIQTAINQGYSYNDICIIISKNTHGNLVANFLIENNIPVVSADSLLLSNANEISIMISFLKYISNQKDLVSASVVVEFLYQNQFCDDNQHVLFLRELNVLKSKTLFDIFTSCKLNIDVLKLSTSNLFDVCLEIINVLKLNQLNPQYIRFFLDEILSFLQSNTSNINLFLDWWSRRSEKASVIIPEGINAVNVMTIHASKGLEFPVVITPYLDWAVEKTKSIWVDIEEDGIELPVALISTSKEADKTFYKPLVEKEKQQQILDNLNMLYVGFTRAVDRLHIISPQSKSKKEKSCHTWLLDFANTQSNYDVEKRKIQFGNLTNKNKSEHSKSGLEQLSIKNIEFNLSQDVVKIKGAANYNTNEDVLKAREYGILVHYILSKIKTIDDIELVIENAVLIGDISHQESLKIATDIKNIVSLNTIAPYFKKGIEVKNELEILTSSGNILRPDRVIVINNAATVIDYKTGKKNAHQYHAQMQDYEKALLDLGYLSVKKVLLYIHEQEVEILN